MLSVLCWQNMLGKICTGITADIKAKIVTYDLARQIEGAKEVKCSEFGKAIIEKMK